VVAVETVQAEQVLEVQAVLAEVDGQQIIL
jgi:hypothetical protein